MIAFFVIMVRSRERVGIQTVRGLAQWWLKPHLLAGPETTDCSYPGLPVSWNNVGRPTQEAPTNAPPEVVDPRSKVLMKMPASVSYDRCWNSVVSSVRSMFGGIDIVHLALWGAAVEDRRTAFVGKGMFLNCMLDLSRRHGFTSWAGNSPRSSFWSPHKLYSSVSLCGAEEELSERLLLTCISVCTEAT